MKTRRNFVDLRLMIAIRIMVAVLVATEAVILALCTIQPIKGGVIGFQWASRMHGFGGDA